MDKYSQEICQLLDPGFVLLIKRLILTFFTIQVIVVADCFIQRSRAVVPNNFDMGDEFNIGNWNAQESSDESSDEGIAV